MASQCRARNQKGSSLLVGIISLVLIVPMAGLMIDVAVLYVVKARLQAAVDGASLAAGRALSLGATTAAQAASAQQNAVNWFYANFPTGNWGTTGTVMNTGTVTVINDPNVAQLRDVTVTASTNAPTYFMKWFNYNSVTVVASGKASRRDVVVMMVLDRSGSMTLNNSCALMIQAAKLFTGQFAEGRDQIGLVTFGDNFYINSSPTVNFQSTLGYSNDSGSGAGVLDTITCSGGTGTAAAVAMGFNELYRMNLPGALNVLLVETDGLPNTLNMNFWDGSTAGISSTSGCKDRNNKTKSNSGFATLASLPNWTTGWTAPSNSHLSSTPSGIVAAMSSGDPSQGPILFSLSSYYTGAMSGWTPLATTNGCATPYGGNSVNTPPGAPDLAWYPATDVYGNQLNPSSGAYQSVTMNGSHVSNSGWTNYHAAVLNATDNAAYQARTNGTIPTYIFTIGLGGNATNPPDYILLQRMANDPSGDNYNSPALYGACSQEATCVNYSSQPQGTFIFSSNSSQLSQAFLQLSSQVLRLSK